MSRTSESEKFAKLGLDIRSLSSVTGALGWDRGEDDAAAALVANPSDVGAKPIPKDVWKRALLTAIALGKAHPHLDAPTPGADPQGFVWLTWRQGDKRGLALELRPGKYRWTQRDGETKKTIESDSLNDVSEAMGSVFVRVFN